MKAVLLYEECGSATHVIRKLGYPARSLLYLWIEEYKETGKLHNGRATDGIGKYSEEEKQHAIEYYMTHGKSIEGTIRALGYPKKSSLSRWVLADRKKPPHDCAQHESLIEYKQEQIVEATVAYCRGDAPISTVAKTYGVGAERIRKCATALLGEGYENRLRKNKTVTTTDISKQADIEEFIKQRTELEQEVKCLQNEVHQLRMERDVFEKVGEIIKKDEGINLLAMTNQEKAIVIDALRSRYQLKELLPLLGIAKSSYCYQEISMSRGDKNASIRSRVKEAFIEMSCRYGYRRIHGLLKAGGLRVSEKRVRLVMRQERLNVYVPKKKYYSSYEGEITPAVENIVDRDFHAERPNVKWLTDITEFSIPAGKVYLSPIIDCFDGMPVSWRIGTSPNAELVNAMLDDATGTLKTGEYPIVHSDRGSHYRWLGWIERMTNAGLTRSMSKKGCSPDNAACEGFFGSIKVEMFYGHNWGSTSIAEFIDYLDEYLHWFCEKRIKMSLKGMSPINYRKSLGLLT